MSAPVPPIREELAQPDIEVLGRIAYAGSQYVQLLTPDDSVLRQRGGHYSVYAEVLRDDQCASTFQQRVDSVIASELIVEPGGKRAIDKRAADFIRETLGNVGFDDACRFQMLADWFGHYVSEIMWETDGRYITIGSIRAREVGRFSFGVDRSLWLRRDTGEDRMPDRKFWLTQSGAYHSDAPYGLGLAHYAYWPVFFKRNGLKFWLTFAEKFAAPTIIGKAPAGQFDDDTRRAQILSQLRGFATNAAILVPEGIDITLLEASRSGTNGYAELQQVMDDAIAKIVLSQTMTTEDGSSRAQAQVHNGVAMRVVKSTADRLCGSFNRGPVSWLTEWNFPGAALPKVWRNTEPAEDMTARAKRDGEIYKLGYEPTDEYIRETYGDGWQRKAVQQGVPPDQLQQIPGQLAAEFAELGALAAMRGAQRIDRQQIVDAANRFAGRYEGVVGDRVRQILSFAEHSGDYQTAAAHLIEAMREAPPAQTVQTVERAGILSRLLGAFRGQR